MLKLNIMVVKEVKQYLYGVMGKDSLISILHKGVLMKH